MQELNPRRMRNPRKIQTLFLPAGSKDPRYQLGLLRILYLQVESETVFTARRKEQNLD
jgi:hypothetical protein